MVVDRNLQTAAHEEPLLVNTAGVRSKRDAVLTLVFGNEQVLHGVVPAETGHAHVVLATGDTLETERLSQT
jgi:hypothetical protein